MRVLKHTNKIFTRQTTSTLKQLSRCLENRTRIESPMSEISDEEVDYGSFDSIANPATDSDRAWSPSID